MSKLIVTGYPGLMIPRRRRPNIQQHLGIKGIIKSVELIDSKTGIVKRRLTEFDNLIVDAGLDHIGAGNNLEDIPEYLACGTDNTAPAVGQTTLGSQLGTRSNDDGGFTDVVAAGGSYAYWSNTRTREMSESQANGNLTELGFFTASSGGVMWMRQLFLSGGSPTTITKTSDERLRVVYEWRVYLTLIPTTDALTINSVPIDCDNRALQVSNGDAWGFYGYVKKIGSFGTDYRSCRAYETNTFPATTGGTFAGSGEYCTSITNVAYGTGNFYRDVDIIFDPGTANFVTGIGAIALPYPGGLGDSTAALGVTFDPRVAKSDLQRFTFRSRLNFGRH